MEMFILGIISVISIIVNAVLYRKYTNTKQYLIESEDRLKDLDMVISALQLALTEDRPKAKSSKPSKKISKAASKKKSKKEVDPAPKKRGRKPNS